MTLVQRRILSATLKAETIRIRSLRAEAQLHLIAARISRPEYEEEQRGLWRQFIDATGCPSYRARTANLALGFLNGKPYKQIEYKTRTKTTELYGVLSGEVASKACVPHDDVVKWMQVPATKEMNEHHAEAKEAARKRRAAAARRYATRLLELPPAQPTVAAAAM